MKSARWSVILLAFLTFPAAVPGSPQGSNPHSDKTTSSAWSAYTSSTVFWQGHITGGESLSHVIWVELFESKLLPFNTVKGVVKCYG
jgi:hypothetical protein